MTTAVALPPLAAGRVYLVVGPNVWGKDADYLKALKIARNEYGAGMKKWIVYDAPADARVDGMGGICYKIVGYYDGMPDAEYNALEAAQCSREVLRVGFKSEGR